MNKVLNLPYNFHRTQFARIIKETRSVTMNIFRKKLFLF